jgi:hypothetical protein
MWIFMSLGVGLRDAPVGVGSSAAVYSMAGRAPLQLAHQRDDGPRPAPQPSREAPPSRWAGPIIDLAAEPGPVQRGRLIDILV